MIPHKEEVYSLDIINTSPLYRPKCPSKNNETFKTYRKLLMQHAVKKFCKCLIQRLG